MNNFNYLKSLSFTELAEWLDKNGQFDGSTWLDWFDNKYCKNCEPIVCNEVEHQDALGLKPPWLSDTIECAYCELEKKCKFFKELNEVPDNKKIIELWFTEEVKDERN